MIDKLIKKEWLKAKGYKFLVGKQFFILILGDEEIEITDYTLQEVKDLLMESH